MVKWVNRKSGLLITHIVLSPELWFWLHASYVCDEIVSDLKLMPVWNMYLSRKENSSGPISFCCKQALFFTEYVFSGNHTVKNDSFEIWVPHRYHLCHFIWDVMPCNLLVRYSINISEKPWRPCWEEFRISKRHTVASL